MLQAGQIGDGLLNRRPYTSETRPRSEYHLTEAGAGALLVLLALVHWGSQHNSAPNGPLRILDRDCAHG